MRPRAKGLVRFLAVALVLVGLLGGVGTLALRPVPPPPTVGMVRTTEIKIQPEVSGRVAALPLRVGDPVSVGDVLAELSNPELKAALEEARAAVAEAKAARARVYAGVRQEEVNIAAGEVDKSKANLTLAKQELTRYTALASKGHASLQELDNARAAESAAEANLRAAQAQFAQAKLGPTAEDRAFADATVAATEASLLVLEKRVEKLTLRSPVNGIVEVVVAERGEAEVPGRTVLTVTGVNLLWFDFNIREDNLDGITIGTILTLSEAGTGRQIHAKVSEMRRLGDFATWRAARAIGDHDLNTFAVRADPIDDAKGLEAGMTVWFAAMPNRG